jgi:hypothetical protein
MRQKVDRMLNELRGELRLFPGTLKANLSFAERQKLFVSTVQEYIRHLADSIRGEYRERVMVRHAQLRLFSRALSEFEGFQATVSEL